VPYPLLAALTGEVDLELCRDVHTRLVSGALALRDRPRDSARLDPERGLVLALDPRREVLAELARERVPELDFGAALERPGRSARALRPLFEAALGPLDELPEDRWALSAAGPFVLGVFAGADTVQYAAFDTAALCSALSSPPADRTDAAGGSGIAVTVRTADAPPLEMLAGPRALPFAGLFATADAPGLAAEVRREQRRIQWLRGGLVLLAVLVATSGLVVARNVRREARLAALRSTFVASVSHDLRTPLAALSLLIENLEHGRVATEAARTRYYGALRQEAERLRRMVEDLLDAARVERGRGPRVEPSATALGPYLDALEQALAERATTAGARLSLTREALPALAHIDAEAVRRALWNLCENALRHGRSEVESADISVFVRGDAEALTFEVRDRGPGVPARHREAIFAPFERLVDRRARRALATDTGTGLGLSIVRAIARAHGGDVVCVPPPDGRGARFVLHITTGPLPEDVA